MQTDELVVCSLPPHTVMHKVVCRWGYTHGHCTPRVFVTARDAELKNPIVFGRSVYLHLNHTGYQSIVTTLHKCV